MKQKKKIENNGHAEGKYSPPTGFELIKNIHSEMLVGLDLEPLPFWEKTQESPTWVKNICQNFSKTIFKSIRKLKPRRTVSWRNYGRTIGIGERYKTFWIKDAPEIMKREGLDKIGKKRWKRINKALGLKEARQHHLKSLGRAANDKISTQKLGDLLLETQFASLDKNKQLAFGFLAHQDAKINALFLKGMSEGYVSFLNDQGEFSGDDRRVDIHLELLAWQNDIEKMRKSVLPKNNKHLIGELKKLPEFKDRTHDWFKDVFKDIKLSIGRKGRPPSYSQA